MSERLSLQIHDFLLEGRDEEKSHVILEIAKPVPEELETHGSFIVLAELTGATPKTIQMVRAWVEFAIDGYYRTTPSNIEQHFEDLLQRLNTQSALYLKQHTEVTLHMAIVAVKQTQVFLSFHGAPSLLLLYKKQNVWQYMNLVEQEGVASTLFSNVMAGALRPGDRLCIASPRVVEFFPPDRITKLCETKNTEGVSEYMTRILSDLSSDVSFAVCWAEVEKIFVPDPTPEMIAAAAGEPKPKQSIRSMKELMRKANSTESLLSPPVISLSKDKIVTNTLHAVQRGAHITGRMTISALRTSFSTVGKTRGPLLRGVKSVWSAAQRSYTTASHKQKHIMKIVACVVGAIIIIGGSILAFTTRGARIAQEDAVLVNVQASIHAADEALTFQKTEEAQAQIAAARAEFNSLDESAQSRSAAVSVEAQITAQELKIFRVTPVTFEQLATNTSATSLVVARTIPFLLSSSDAVSVLRNGVVAEAARVDGAAAMVYNADADKIIIAATNAALTEIDARTYTKKELVFEKLPEHTTLDASVIYSGRLYTYDKNLQKIFRYEKTPQGFGTGKSWITDGSKPVDVAHLAADSSLWLLTNSGAILKFTSGRAQPFKISGVVPELKHIDALQLGAGSQNLYALDRDQNRVVVLSREGKLIKQYKFAEKNNLTTFDIDEKETAVFGITDDGRLVKFAVTK